MEFHTKKRFGQNFISDTGFLDSVVGRHGLKKTDTIVEIGAGAGCLTAVLAKYSDCVIAYEIDKALEPILHEKFRNTPNVKIIIADVLDIPDVAPLSEKYKIVANIPYYITTPLVMKFLNDARCTEICVLVQSEVADRIAAKPNTAEYGALSVTCQTMGECKIIKRVARTMFKPVPKVDSAFVTIKKNGVFVPNGFDVFIKKIFSRRRKVISNSVDVSILEKLGINPTLRPENLTPAQFVKIFENSPNKPEIRHK